MNLYGTVITVVGKEEDVQYLTEFLKEQEKKVCVEIAPVKFLGSLEE